MVKPTGKYTFYCICGYIPEKTSLTESFHLINEHNKVCNETLELVAEQNKNIVVK